MSADVNYPKVFTAGGHQYARSIITDYTGSWCTVEGGFLLLPLHCFDPHRQAEYAKEIANILAHIKQVYWGGDIKKIIEGLKEVPGYEAVFDSESKVDQSTSTAN